MPHLALGDRVTITDPYFYRNGEQGRIVDLKALVALVQWQSDHKKIWYDQTQLTKIK